MVTDSFLKDPIRVLIHSDSAHKNFLSIKCLPKLQQQNQRLLCALLTSAWYFMVLPTTRRDKNRKTGQFWGKTPPWCDSAFESDLPEFWGKMPRGEFPKVWPGKAIKTVPTSPRFVSCKVTSFDKNAGQIRTQMSSHWQHMTA